MRQGLTSDEWKAFQLMLPVANMIQLDIMKVMIDAVMERRREYEQKYNKVLER